MNRSASAVRAVGPMRFLGMSCISVAVDKGRHAIMADR